MKIKVLFLALFCLFNISGGPRQRIGLLTEDYNIVTDTDLNEEEQNCAIIYPFPPPYPYGGCFHYWQCLPTNEVLMNCEELEELKGIADSEDTGQIDFRIKNGQDIHYFYTRRNFNMQSCWEWIEEWKDVMRGEDVVCISGIYLNMEEFKNGPKHYYWIIDRMKSRYSEWSYFYRGKEDEMNINR